MDGLLIVGLTHGFAHKSNVSGEVEWKHEDWGWDVGKNSKSETIIMATSYCFPIVVAFCSRDSQNVLSCGKQWEAVVFIHCRLNSRYYDLILNLVPFTNHPFVIVTFRMEDQFAALHGNPDMWVPSNRNHNNRLSRRKTVTWVSHHWVINRILFHSKYKRWNLKRMVRGNILHRLWTGSLFFLEKKKDQRPVHRLHPTYSCSSDWLCKKHYFSWNHYFRI